MSLLVNADGSLKNYVVVDTRAETIVEAFNWVGDAIKGKDKLIRDGATDLALHNITHPKCPDWLKELIRSDGVYCSHKAEYYDARAVSLRRKAASLIAEAEDYERSADKWREFSQAASEPSVPGM